MSRRAIWIPTVLLVLVCALVAVTVPGPVRNTSRFGRVLLPEMIPTRDIVYSFVMNEDGLSGIELSTAAVSAAPAGRVRFRLYAHDNPVPLADGDVPTGQLVRDGRYVFRVKASNSDGVWSEASSLAVRVTVAPPFWATWWFRVLGAAVRFLYCSIASL